MGKEPCFGGLQFLLSASPRELAASVGSSEQVLRDFHIKMAGRLARRQQQQHYHSH